MTCRNAVPGEPEGPQRGAVLPAVDGAPRGDAAVVYTPTVGTAIERYSYEFGRPRGVYLSVDHTDQVETALRNTGLGPRMWTWSWPPTRKASSASATRARRHRDRGRQAGRLHRGGGISPGPGSSGGAGRGTDNPGCCSRQTTWVPATPAIRDGGMTSCLRPTSPPLAGCSRTRCCTGKTSAPANARRVLNRYAESCCTFNDDMQGTAAVVLAAALAAIRTPVAG